MSEVQGQQECERKCGDSERRLSEPTETFASTVVNHRRKLQSGGGSLFIDYAQVYDPDLATLTTGIIHGINQVLIPDTHDMISTLEEQGEFTTLLSLIELAELGDAIMTTTPITLFGEDSFRFLMHGYFHTSSHASLLLSANGLGLCQVAKGCSRRRCGSVEPRAVGRCLVDSRDWHCGVLVYTGADSYAAIIVGESTLLRQRYHHSS